MTGRDIEKLLGGYATGTLTDDERRRLFEAALHDQALFDALTHEDALKEVLDDPTHRRRLLAALEAQRVSRHPFGGLPDWLRRPANLALAGTLATAVIAAWVFVALERERPVTTPAEDRGANVEQLAREAETQMDVSTAKDVQEPSAAGRKPEAEVAPARKKPARTAPAADRRPAQRPARSATRADPEPASKPPTAAEAAQPKSEAKRAAGSASSAAAPAAGMRGGPAWLTSYRRPVERGPARQLYYARRTPMPRFEPRGLTESRDEEVEREPEASQVEPPGSLEPLGLRYSVLKRDEQGDFKEANPDGPFRADDVMRVTVEVNETGYLYVFRLGPRGEWLWITPSGPLGKQERESGVGVLGGKRYVIPGTGVLPLFGQPSANKLILIYSRQPRQELQVFHPAVLERQTGDDRPSADLETPLSRARIETSTQPLLVEEVQPDEGEGPQERAVYIVNPDEARDAAIAIELTFPSEG